MSIFKTKVTNIGKEAEMFLLEKMIILFGENAPETLADYCFNINLEKVIKEIAPGMTLVIDGEEFQITSVGNVVTYNLNQLGHITIKFDGSVEPELAGTLYVEKKDIPQISVGSIIEIKE